MRMYSKYYIPIVFRIIIYEDITNYSNWIQNYIRSHKYTDEFNEIFYKILNQAIEYWVVNIKNVFGYEIHQQTKTN